MMVSGKTEFRIQNSRFKIQDSKIQKLLFEIGVEFVEDRAIGFERQAVEITRGGCRSERAAKVQRIAENGREQRRAIAA